MSIRLVAVDVDGTLVTSDQRVLPRVQDAVRRAAAQGVELVLCTGRAIGGVLVRSGRPARDPLRRHAHRRHGAGSEDR